MTPSEEWRPVPGGWELLYEVSSQGRVRSLGRPVRTKTGGTAWRKGHLLKPTTRSKTNGYLGVVLYWGSGRTTFSVHQLVLLAFVGPPPPEMQVRHLNGVCTDNRLENLRYGTRSENMRDKVRHGTHHLANVTECPQGHAYDEANTYVRTDKRTGYTMRHCRECHRQNERARRARRAAERKKAA